MTIIFEISGPFQKKFWKYSNDVMTRFGFWWFAFGWLKVPFKEFTETPYYWSK